jgi:hypothetical protein
MADMRSVETDHKQAEFRQRQPHWHLPPQYAAFAIRIVFARPQITRPFAGDDKRGAHALRLGAVQETQQFGMGLRLRHAVQIETRFDRFAPARDTLLQPAIE